MDSRNSRPLYALAALMLVLCLALPGRVDGSAARVLQGGPGSIEQVEGITVVRLSGTPREMGLMHTRLLSDRLAETEAAFNKIMPPVPGGAFGRWLLRLFVMLQLPGIEKHLTPAELEEMKGMAEGGPDKGRDYRDLLYYHVLQDIGQNFACTGGAACGKASALSGPVTGRNFDMAVEGELDTLKTIFLHEPEGGAPYVTVAWPGMAGAVTGMNNHGLCVMVFSAHSENSSLSGVPVAFLARRVLEGAAGLDSAVEIIKAAKRMGPAIFLVADRTRAAAIEFDADWVEVVPAGDGVLTVANHFVGERLGKDPKNLMQYRYSDSRQRLERIDTLLRQYARVGVKNMVEALRDHACPDGETMAWADPAAVNNLKDAHSVVFDPAGLRLWVSTPPSAYGKFIGFRLGQGGLERIKDIPESAYPGSAEGTGARTSHEYYKAAIALADEGQDYAAIECAWNAMGMDPANYRAAILCGRLCMGEYRYEEAYSAFESAVYHAPGCYPAMAEALAGRGDAARRTGRPKQARADFEAVIEMDCSEEAVEAAYNGLKYL